MKLVLDLQARQSYGSHHRGIGRYALALSRAMARQANAQQEIHLAVNAAFPHYVEEIKQDFQGLVDSQHIHAFAIPTPAAGLHQENSWRIRAAEHVRENFLRNLQPDIVHVSSLFEGVDDDVVTSVCDPHLAQRTSVTLHDLIPLIQADHYLADPRTRAWYYRKLQSLKNAELILSVSEYSRQEGIDVLGLDPEKTFTVPNAVEDSFRILDLSPQQRQQWQQQFRISKNYILYIGGVEYRKNVDRLIAAYAQLAPELRQQYQLVIAGKLRDYQHEHMLKVMKQQGLSSQDMVLTGAVDDEELVALYNMASLFVFPSLYEGFGLPVLEAMACGAPTIVADNSSLPEVVGLAEATFPGEDTVAMSQKIAQCLSDEGFRQHLLDKAAEQVKIFSWDRSAQRALDIFSEQHERQQTQQQVALSIAHKPRLAVVCNFPAQLSATRQQLVQLLPALARHYSIEIISDQAVAEEHVWLCNNYPVHSREYFRQQAQRYERCVYALDVQHCDADLLQLLQEQAGVLLLSQLYLAELQNTASMLYLAEGYEALIAQTQQQVVAPALRPWLNAALGVIATDEQMLCAAQAYFPAASLASWHSIAAEPVAAPGLCVSKQQASHYHQAIEQCYRAHPRLREQQLLKTLQGISASTAPSQQDWWQVANSVVDNQTGVQHDLPVLFYEVSIFVWGDHKTGVHRVTRNMLEELFRNPPAGYRLEPIYAHEGHYRYARKMTHELLGLAPPQLDDDIVTFKANDILLHVDLGLHIAADMEPALQAIRARGVQIYYLVHDILAMRLPKAYFEKAVLRYFRQWLDAVTRVADGLICTTQTGVEDIQAWLTEHPPERHSPIRLGRCTLGTDIPQPTDPTEITAAEQSLLTQFKQQPSLLMVSTIEPRKGYAQALDAFELLWQQGSATQLVIVGKPGWNMEDFITRIEQHPENGKRLHWLKFVSDAMLARLYENCAGLLMASEGEGFGLPLIEAAQHRMPVIARGIPVFKEIAGEHAWFFEGTEPQALADSVQQWLAAWQQGEVPQSEHIEWISWQDSVAQLKEFLFAAEEAKA